MSRPSWKEVLPRPPAGGELMEAWMTSFEPPDAGLFVKHLLPSLLGARHSLTQDIQQRLAFFGELGTALEALHGRLTVVSSPARATDEAGATGDNFPWLWRYVSHFKVGAVGPATQHAKLWAFRWRVGDTELLELQVSSTNLSTAAFKQQVQASWRASLPLAERGSAQIRNSWGALVGFLDALARSAGPNATERIERLRALLGRAECPAGATFVASIPGQPSAGRQLAQLQPSRIHVLAPTIGEWNARTLSAWSDDVGVAPGKIHLAWISTKHPWAKESQWRLSFAAHEALEDKGVKIECLPNDARFTEAHLAGDDRWSHAKLYLIRSRSKRRLLVTSANWSASAWGAGKLSPRNFELGVLFETEWTDLERMGDPFDPPDTEPFCGPDRVDEQERASRLEWAEATWDGRQIKLCARSTDRATAIEAVIAFTKGGKQRVALVDGAAAMPWSDPLDAPCSVRFEQGDEALEVDVLDLRLPHELRATPLPEVDPAVVQALRDAFLLQRYGGPLVEADSISLSGDGGNSSTAGTVTADYSVQAWVDGRAAFRIIDCWRERLDRAGKDPILRATVRRDGEDLRDYYRRGDGPAAALAAEELGWRLEQEGT